MNRTGWAIPLLVVLLVAGVTEGCDNPAGPSRAPSATPGVPYVSEANRIAAMTEAGMCTANHNSGWECAKRLTLLGVALGLIPSTCAGAVAAGPTQAFKVCGGAIAAYWKAVGAYNAGHDNEGHTGFEPGVPYCDNNCTFWTFPPAHGFNEGHDRGSDGGYPNDWGHSGYMNPERPGEPPPPDKWDEWYLGNN